MEIKVARKRPTITTTMTLPMSDEQKSRYKESQHKVDAKNIAFVVDGVETSSIHDLTRQKIDELLNYIDGLIASA
jgi:hypothetical protein